jgi:S-adenosylmethionine:tRNA ribosyltransferase-isomerase
MNLSDFDYELPEELIAQYPSETRDSSRLMVIERATGRIMHSRFANVGDFLTPPDTLVLNDTRVIPARLLGRRKTTGARVEVLLLRRVEGLLFEVLVKCRGRLNPGEIVTFNDRLMAEMMGYMADVKIMKFDCDGNFQEILEEIGSVPLPPYIKRKPEDMDRERYQTVYAKRQGAVAAPTAGLHFTDGLLKSLANSGIAIAYLTLHVGYGTFKPVRAQDIAKHNIAPEYYELPRESAQVINSGRRKGARVVAVGTTTCRVLETCAATGSGNGCVAQETGWSGLFIYPPFEFKVTDALITNFHLPGTTLLLMASAFCGRELLLKAYGEAIKQGYRFYSYGDAMLIL